MGVNGHRTQQVRFERVLPGSPDDVHTVLTDPEFLRQYVGRTGSGGSRVVVAPDRSRTCLRRVVPTRLGPPFVASFLGAAVDVVEVVTWTGAEAGGARAGQICAEASVAPGEARFRGVVALTPEDEESCRWVVDGHLSVKLPLIGGKLTPLVVTAIESALLTEARLAEQVLRSRPATDTLRTAAGL